MTRILTIAADHPSVVDLRAMTDDLAGEARRVLENAMIAAYGDCDLESELYEALALAPTYQAHVVLLRRLSDGALGILRTPSEEDDADLMPGNVSTFEQLTEEDRSLVVDALGAGIRDFDLPDAACVLSAIARDATAVDLSNEDRIAAVRRHLAPGMDKLRQCADRTQDDHMKEVVEEALARIDAAMKA